MYMGCGLGGSEELQAHYERYLADPPRRLRAATTPMIMSSGPASHISMTYGIIGPSVTYSIACVSSAVAIGEAFRAIRHGYLDTALAGGAEAQLNTGTLAGWRELSVLASEHATGAEASSRPFDTHRTGLVLGEGAIVLVLESESAARARGAEPLAEIVGYGVSSDAFNLTEPCPDGQARAMQLALEDASVSCEPYRVCQCTCHGHILGRSRGGKGHQEYIRLACGQAGGKLHKVGARPPDRRRERAGGCVDGSYVTDRPDRANREPHRSRSGVPPGLRAVGRPRGAEAGVRSLELIRVWWKQRDIGTAKGDGPDEDGWYGRRVRCFAGETRGGTLGNRGFGLTGLILQDPIISSGGFGRVTPYAFMAGVLIEKYDVARDAISPEATLTELGLDSLTVVELLFDVEDEFEIEVPEERATFQTLAEAAALVEELVQAKGA